jgi:CspA family cold shock protein
MRIMGSVKWFNNKAGYGFITCIEGEHNTKDIFVHFSAITVSNDQFRFLVQGEFVHFDLILVENDKHEFQAKNVTGINGGKLMCENQKQGNLNTNHNDKPKSNPKSKYEKKH